MHHEARHCTDCCCVVLFVLAMGLLGVVGRVAKEAGDPSLIFFARDHFGRRCGVGTLAHVPKVFFPQLSSDLARQPDKLSRPWELELFGVCVSSCPIRGPEGAVPEYVSDAGLSNSARQWPVGEGTVDVLNRCVPTETPPKSATSSYCAKPTCHEVTGARCADVPGHDGEGLWRLEGDAATSCVRELVLTSIETSRVPGTGPLVRSISKAVASLSVAVEQVMAAHAEVHLSAASASIHACMHTHTRTCARAHARIRAYTHIRTMHACMHAYRCSSAASAWR